MNGKKRIAKIAVSPATPGFDKPFDYLVPDAMSSIDPGDRVLVPFGRGNKYAEGVVLAVEAGESQKMLKEIVFKYDDGVRLSKEDIALALWMRSRYFCSFFECAAAMLPPGSWQKPNESGKLKGYRSIRFVRTDAAPDDVFDVKALGRGEAGKRRLAALSYLAEHGQLPEKELCYQTGAGAGDIKALAERGLLEVFYLPKYMSPEPAEVVREPFELSDKQRQVFDGICGLLDKGAGCALLRGVTGSGKTAVYIELIRKVIATGKSAMMLVPEIALTPQIVREFRGHFGSSVAVIHSGLDSATRYDEYMRIKTGRVSVVIGTRSAVFAPFENLGIIIVDEEHETSYRSDAAPRYDAVEVAKYRCVKNNCLLLLGSATPSIESYYRAKEGKYSLFTLDERFNDFGLPETLIADMKESLKSGDASSIGPQLREEIAKTLERGEQAILFINRRGSAKMAMCADCGYIPQCENCSVSLTYHSANGRLMCHHCGYSEPLMETCPECGGSHIKLIGTGTQKIEDELAEFFPGARVLRMDADTTTGRRSHEEILDAFGRGEADILLGTQMVAKGLDFPNVTLVGVVDADMELYGGSYNSGERSFELISQVVGRAGRRDKPGRAVIQSFSPANPIIDAASKQDYLAFYDHEIDVRRLIKAPPFYDIFTFFMTSADEARAEAAAETMAEGLREAFRSKYADLAAPVLGPNPAVIAKISNKYRFVVSFKGKESKDSRRLMWDMLMWFYSQPQSRGVSVAADINALYF